MKASRRHFMRLAGGVVALPALPRIAAARAYPARPVHWLVGFAAGGPTDITARLMGSWLSQRFGQQFVIENRPGAGTNLATAAVARALADGYTLLLVTVANSVNASLYGNLEFNFINDITPVAGILRAPNVMVINPSVPARTLPEFIAYAKANPGRINMATAGNGSGPHIYGELFKMMAGVELVPIAYRGGAPGLTDLLAGQVQVMFEGIFSSLGYIRDGRLRALAVTTAARSAALPDVPTVSEFVPGYEASGFFGVGAPKNTPAEIVDKLNSEINAGLADPTLKARIVELGGVPIPMTPAEFGNLIVESTEKWAKVIRALGIKAA
jgi:tripartite-type tricarboxylate transporter receptor subunit TctC